MNNLNAIIKYILARYALKVSTLSSFSSTLHTAQKFADTVAVGPL